MIRTILTALALASATMAAAETLTNDSILAMQGAGLSDDVIVAKIRNSPNSFDTSTEQVIALKATGISPAVLAAMISGPAMGSQSRAALSADSADPNVPHAAGVYLLNEWSNSAKAIKIDASSANLAKTGGFFGYALTGGLASMSVKAVIPGGTARAHAGVTQPTFYFYVDQTGTNIFSGPMGVSVTPNEFSLVRLAAKGGRREARVGSMNIGSMKTGVMDKDRIGFAYDQVAPGVYKVKPSAPLTPGEYGFLYQPAASAGFGPNTAGATGVRVFDFSVGAP